MHDPVPLCGAMRDLWGANAEWEPYPALHTHKLHAGETGEAGTATGAKLHLSLPEHVTITALTLPPTTNLHLHAPIHML